MVFVLIGKNDSFLGFAMFFEEYPLTMIDAHKWDSALYEVHARSEEAVFVIETDWVLCEVRRTRLTV